MHNATHTVPADLLVEAAREAGRQEARRLITHAVESLESQSRARAGASGDGIQAPFDAHAVLGALRRALAV